MELCFTRLHFVILYSILATGNILLMFNSLAGQNIRLHIIYFGGGCDRTFTCTAQRRNNLGSNDVPVLLVWKYLMLVP